MRQMFVLVLLMIPFYTAEAQRSSGQGESLQDAVVDGIFNVVSVQTGGVINRDVFQNTESVFSALTNIAAGLISNFSIVEKNQAGTGNWDVSLEVTVDKSVLESNNVEKLVKQRIARWDKVQSGLFRNRSVVVVYDDRNLVNAIRLGTPEVLSVMDQIENQLANLHFDVIVSGLDLAALKRQKPVSETADAIVIATLQKAIEPYEHRDGVTYIQVTAYLKAYDTHTQRVLANFPERKKDLVKGDVDTVADAISRIAGKAGKAAAGELARNIVMNYRTEGSPILITISAISEDNMDALIDGLEEVSISYKVERYSREVLQIKLITVFDAIAVRRIIRNIAKEKKFELKTIQQHGDTLNMTVATTRDRGQSN